MILENYIPGKIRANSPKIALCSGFIPWSASKSEITLTLDGTEVERRYTLHLTPDEARAMRRHLDGALESTERYEAADKARATISQVERALG
jgi:hypothetical protein